MAQLCWHGLSTLHAGCACECAAGTAASFERDRSIRRAGASHVGAPAAAIRRSVWCCRLGSHRAPLYYWSGGFSDTAMSGAAAAALPSVEALMRLPTTLPPLLPSHPVFRALDSPPCSEPYSDADLQVTVPLPDTLLQLPAWVIPHRSDLTRDRAFELHAASFEACRTEHWEETMKFVPEQLCHTGREHLGDHNFGNAVGFVLRAMPHIPGSDPVQGFALLIWSLQEMNCARTVIAWAWPALSWIVEGVARAVCSAAGASSAATTSGGPPVDTRTVQTMLTLVRTVLELLGDDPNRGHVILPLAETLTDVLYRRRQFRALLAVLALVDEKTVPGLMANKFGECTLGLKANVARFRLQRPTARGRHRRTVVALVFGRSVARLPTTFAIGDGVEMRLVEDRLVPGVLLNADGTDLSDTVYYHFRLWSESVLAYTDGDLEFELRVRQPMLDSALVRLDPAMDVQYNRISAQPTWEHLQPIVEMDDVADAFYLVWPGTRPALVGQSYNKVNGGVHSSRRPVFLSEGDWLNGWWMPHEFHHVLECLYTDTPEGDFARLSRRFDHPYANAPHSEWPADYAATHRTEYEWYDSTWRLRVAGARPSLATRLRSRPHKDESVEIRLAPGELRAPGEGDAGPVLRGTLAELLFVMPQDRVLLSGDGLYVLVLPERVYWALLRTPPHIISAHSATLGVLAVCASKRDEHTVVLQVGADQAPPGGERLVSDALHEAGSMSFEGTVADHEAMYHAVCAERWPEVLRRAPSHLHPLAPLQLGEHNLGNGVGFIVRALAATGGRRSEARAVYWLAARRGGLAARNARDWAAPALPWLFDDLSPVERSAWRTALAARGCTDLPL